MVVETMGRHSGWIACFAGLAVGADYILVPEVPIDLPHLLAVLTKRRSGGKKRQDACLVGTSMADRVACVTHFLRLNDQAIENLLYDLQKLVDKAYKAGELEIPGTHVLKGDA